MKIFLNFLLVFSLVACQQGEKKGTSKPASSGRNGELLVVANDELWLGPAGKWVRETFSPPAPGLPQAEPIFKVVRVKEADFKSLLYATRNIVFLQKKDTAASLKIARDVWAAPQLVATFYGKDNNELLAFLAGKELTLRRTFLDRELEGIGQRLKSTAQPLPKELKAWGLDFVLPRGFAQSGSTPDVFVWWSRGKRSDQGLLVYRYPRNNQVQPDPLQVLELRDSITQRNVPGDREGSYMVVERDYPPFAEYLDLGGTLALTIRSLWKTHGDFMGGPFQQVILPSEDGKWWYVLDAFVYAPEIPKRPLTLETEGVLRSARVGAP